MSTYEYLHAEAQQHHAMAHHHLTKMKMVLDEMAVAKKVSMPVASPVRCVREWTDWLAANGPALKGTVAEGTMTKFTERGSKYTVDWSPMLADAADDLFAPNTLMKISGKPKGRGAPPKIYFLWSQRWDVHPLFVVGPIKPDPEFVPVDGDVQLMSVSLDNEPGPAGGTILGVIQPPVSSHPIDPDYGDEQSIYWDGDELELHTESGPVRADTMDKWDENWASFFDTLVATETKPTDEQKQAMYDTLPEGADRNAALAIAYRAAVERARQT